MSNLHIILLLLVYILTGVTQPMLIDYLRIHHLLGHKHLLLPTLCNVSGMAFCGLLASKSQWDQFYYYYYHNNILAARRIKRMIGYTALVDLVSGMCLTFGLLLTGGSMFVVLYNSCPVWTAILSRFILKQSLNKAQIMSVVMVSIGLVMNVLVNSTSTDSSTDSSNGSNGSQAGGQEHQHTLDQQSVIQEEHYQFSLLLIVGSIIVLIGSLLHSLMFVLSDMSMMSIMHQLHHMESNLSFNPDSSSKNSIEQLDGKDKDKDGIPGEIWSCCLGTLEVVFMTVWVVFGILLSGFDDEDTRLDTKEDGIQYHGIDYNRFLKVILGLITLTTVSCLHAASFFKLLKHLGAVASALLKGVQAVVVVMLSAILYCPLESSQCLTWSKFFSMMIVLSGVFGYGLGSRKKHDIRIMNPLVNSRSNMELSHRSESESLIERF